MNEPGPYVRYVPTMGKGKPQSPSTSPYIRQTPKFVQAKPGPIAPIVAQGTMEGFGTWTLDENGLLFISGKGQMPDWGYNGDTINTTAPWWKIRDVIKQIQIAMGVTSIGSSAFKGCTSLTSITIPNSVTQLGTGVFMRCKNLRKVTMPSRFNHLFFELYHGISRGRGIVTFA